MSLNSIDRIKANYKFSPNDVEELRALRPMMNECSGEFVHEFYEFVKGFDEAHKFLKDEATIKRHQDAIRYWFINLFSGYYGPAYYEELTKVGLAHVKVNLPAHYVNAAMHFVKQFIRSVLHRDLKDPDRCVRLMYSVDKIIDINLDVFTSSYIEEEKKFFLSQKVETRLIGLANRFSHGLNLILVLGLVVLGLMVIGLFAYDVTHIFQGDIEKGLLSTLGSLLMLWVVIELMDTEIKHLRGGKFAIRVFVSVALVAIIRKILVTSLKSEAVEAQISLIAAVAVLGGVYWLISKAE